tara:strand:- start:10021 stop:11568 length:1548 start_codon:yes stop_codon:yes gene_type:complete
MTPKNKLATDKEIIEAIKEHGTHKLAAKALGMATQTVSNRLGLINKRGVHIDAPVTRPDSGIKAQTKKIKRYVVTCAMSNAPVSSKFLDILHNFCDHEKAQLVVIPQQYNWQDHLSGKQAAVYDESIEEYLLAKDIKVDSHLVIKGSYPLHATLINPLMGLSMASPERSCIFGHPSRAFKTVATAQDKYPLLHYTTAAVTEPRYTRSKSGQKSRDMHKIGAMFIESNGEEFHCHELNYSEEHSNVQMLDKIYTGDSVVFSSVAGLVCGDEHAAQADQSVIDALYRNDKSLVNVLKPEYVVRHDVYDHDADSHHTRKNTVARFVRSMKGTNDVEKELKLTADHLDVTTGDFKNIIVASNHVDHLDQWLNEFSPHTGDPINFPIYHYLNWRKFEGLKQGHTKGAFQLYCQENMKCYENTVWTSRNKEFKINGVVVSNHGDISANGARGGAGLAMLGINMVIGHCHSPYINKRVYAVGAQMLRAGYTNGYSGWLTTNCAIYGNGEKALINIINGKWRV